MTRILAFDPGIAHLGRAVITVDDDGLHYGAHGTFKTVPKYAMSVRVGMLYRYIHDCLVEYKPDAVVTEDVFSHGLIYSGKETAKVIGLIELACDDRGIPCHILSPSEIKLKVAGSGKAKKADMTMGVRRLLHDAPISDKPSCEHENDALAIAIAYTMPDAVKKKGGKA